MTGTATAGRIQSVSRALRLLKIIIRGDVGATTSELAAAAGLPVPTAHHLLGTLTAQGFLARDARRGYVLGPASAMLADAYHRDTNPPEYLLDPLRELVQITRETGYLATWRQGDITLLAVVDGDLPVRVAVPAGPYQDAFARASGKLLLALAPERLRAEYLAAHPLRAVTHRTVTGGQQLAKQLADIKAIGYAVDVEEFQEGVSCIAAPVLHDGVLVASYALSVPAERFRTRRPELVTALLAATGSVFGSPHLAAAR